MRVRSLSFFLSLFTAQALGADFTGTPPPSWRKPTIDASWTDVNATTTAAIQKVFDFLGSGQYASADFYSILASYDAYTNQTLYQASVVDYFSRSPFAADFYNDNPLNHAINAIRSYDIYRDTNMLKIATDAWDYARAYTISDSEASSGRSAVKNFNLTSNCDGATMAGGTYWNNDVNDATIYGYSSAAFFTLSAYLSTTTTNSAYLDAARQAGNFMVAVMNVTQPGNGKAAISANASADCHRDNFGSGTFRLHNAGVFLEGLSLLSANQRIGDVAVDDLRATLVNVTLTANDMANAQDGIINTGGGVGNTRIVQGLGAVYHRNAGQVNLRSYIGQYLSVQYTSLRDSAGDSNIYSSAWSGSDAVAASYDQGNQTFSIYALVNAAQVSLSASQGSDNGDNGGGNNGGGGDDDQPSIAGPIAGGVVGGLAVLSAIGLLIFFLRRRRQRNAPNDRANFFVDEPFTPPTAQTDSPFVSSAVPSSSSGAPAVTTGFYQGKRHRAVPSGQGSSSGGMVAPPSVDPPSTVGSSPHNRDISTDELVRLLEERINREQVAPADIFVPPPAYEGSQDNGTGGSPQHPPQRQPSGKRRLDP